MSNRVEFVRAPLLQKLPAVKLPTQWGTFDLVCYTEPETGVCHPVLTIGDLSEGVPPVIRLHSECLTGEVFGSQRCDCGPQLHQAMAVISAEGRGALLYLRQEGRGIGLANKLRAYALQEAGLDTVEANLALGLPEDARDYSVAVAILRDMCIQDVRLLSNNPLKVEALRSAGIAVERVPIHVSPVADNLRYLQVKASRMGHMLPW